MTLFSMTVFTGPLLAPFIGGFTVMNPDLGWRWTEYIAAIMGFLALGLNLIFLQETYPPVVLVDKASELVRRLSMHCRYRESCEHDTRCLSNLTFSEFRVEEHGEQRS